MFYVIPLRRSGVCVCVFLCTYAYPVAGVESSVASITYQDWGGMWSGLAVAWLCPRRRRMQCHRGVPTPKTGNFKIVKNLFSGSGLRVYVFLSCFFPCSPHGWPFFLILSFDRPHAGIYFRPFRGRQEVRPVYLAVRQPRRRRWVLLLLHRLVFLRGRREPRTRGRLGWGRGEGGQEGGEAGVGRSCDGLLLNREQAFAPSPSTRTYVHTYSRTCNSGL